MRDIVRIINKGCPCDVGEVDDDADDCDKTAK